MLKPVIQTSRVLLVHQDSPHWKAKGQSFEDEQVETKDRKGKKITKDGCYVVWT
jgi:hypothetical protein